MLPLVALLAVFGIVLPWWKGRDFLDPVMVGAYACLGGLFAAPAAARAFGVTRPASWKSALGRVVKAAAYGEGMALLMLALGIATVNLTRGGRLRLPELDTLAETGLFGLSLTAAFAAVAAWFTMRFSPDAARRAARFGFLCLAIAFYYGSARLPEVALEGAALTCALTAAACFLIHRELRPQ